MKKAAMHSELEKALNRMREHFQQDERCLAMFVTGSLAKQTADEFSDIDIAIVVADAHYAAVKTEMQNICERLCGKIIAWLPEGEQPELVNYAYLFETSGHLLLCDFLVISERFQKGSPSLKPHQVLFDKGDICIKPSAEKPVSYGVADLSMTMRIFWVYAYLDGKYFMRKDIYKMLYVQYALFLQHVNLFKAFQPELEWGWWARDTRYLTPEQQNDLLVYFGATRIDEITAAFAKALDMFSRDAQRACQAWNMEYPIGMEQSIRGHLKRMGVLQ